MRTGVFYTRKKYLPERANFPQAEQGSVRLDRSFGILLFLIFLSGMYVFSINSNAVQGYRMRHLEERITEMQEENARLRISLADAKSFQRIEAVSESLTLQKAEEWQYFEEHDRVASR